MKKIYLFFIALLSISASLQAQVSVTATAGASSGSYPSLKAAFDAINSGGHQGVINILINASITETATARLNASEGPAHYSRVHISPTVDCIISGNIAGMLIDLNGADSVTFDGRTGSTGIQRSLTIQNLNNDPFSSYTSTIGLNNGANANELRYLNIEGSGQGYNSGTVYIGSGPNSNNLIASNEIRPAAGNLPCVGIRAYSQWSNASTENRNNVISNNDIHDFLPNTSGIVGGIMLDIANSHSIIEGNSIYLTVPLTGKGSMYFISATYGSGSIIRNNYIGGSAPFAANGPAISNGIPVTGIWTTGQGSDTTVIEGNTIGNFNLNTSIENTSRLFTGIAASGGMRYTRISGNTIGAAGAGDVVAATYAAASRFTGMTGIYVPGAASGSDVMITSNKIGGFILNAADTSASLTGIDIGARSLVKVEGNIIGGPASGSMQLNAGSGTVAGIKMAYPGENAAYTCSQNTIRHLYNNCSGGTDAITRGIATIMNAGEGISIESYITGNRITHLHTTAAAANNGTVQGIYSSLSAAARNSYVRTYVTGNTIDTLSSESSGYSTMVMGIGSHCPNERILIDSNSVHTLRSAAANTNALAAAVQGICTDGLLAASISRNRIYDLESTTGAASTVIGVNSAHKSNISPYILSKNQIYDLRNNHSEGGVVLGASLRGITGTGQFFITNNMISLSPENVTVYGIMHNATGIGMKLYYNTIAIGGKATGSRYSGAFYRTWGVNTNISSYNNIFQNTRTGGSGRHYALRNDHAYPGAVWANSNYNDLYSSNPRALVSWRVVSLSLSQYRDSSGQDLSSKSVHADFVDSLSGDLHLLDTDSNRLLAGIAIDDVKDDFDGDTRHDHPAMGADEIVIITPMLVRSQEAFSHPADPGNDQDEKQFLLYPNPTADMLRINIAGSHETVTFTIFDMSGREQLTQKLRVSGAGTPVINVQPLKAGTYLLQVITSKGAITKTFVKM